MWVSCTLSDIRFRTKFLYIIVVSFSSSYIEFLCHDCTFGKQHVHGICFTLFSFLVLRNNHAQSMYVWFWEAFNGFLNMIWKELNK